MILTQQFIFFLNKLLFKIYCIYMQSYTFNEHQKLIFIEPFPVYSQGGKEEEKRLDSLNHIAFENQRPSISYKLIYFVFKVNSSVILLLVVY